MVFHLYFKAISYTTQGKKEERMNPKGYPPAIYRELFAAGLLKAAA